MARDRKSDQHRRLTQAELGRKLGPNEVVDHVDGDKENNTKMNRRVMSRSEHSRMHASRERKQTDKLRKALTMDRRRERLY